MKHPVNAVKSTETFLRNPKYDCPHCGTSFGNSKAAKLRHIAEEHPEMVEKTLACGFKQGELSLDYSAPAPGPCPVR